MQNNLCAQIKHTANTTADMKSTTEWLNRLRGTRSLKSSFIIRKASLWYGNIWKQIILVGHVFRVSDESTINNDLMTLLWTFSHCLHTECAKCSLILWKIIDCPQHCLLLFLTYQHHCCVFLLYFLYILLISINTSSDIVLDWSRCERRRDITFSVRANRDWSMSVISDWAFMSQLMQRKLSYAGLGL